MLSGGSSGRQHRVAVLILLIPLRARQSKLLLLLLLLLLLSDADDASAYSKAFQRVPKLETRGWEFNVLGLFVLMLLLLLVSDTLHVFIMQSRSTFDADFISASSCDCSFALRVRQSSSMRVRGS